MLRAGYISIAVFLIALGPIGIEVAKLELEHHKLKYEVEYAIKSSIDEADCTKVAAAKPSCLLAQHSQRLLTIISRIWSGFIKMSLVVGSVLLTVGLLGWASRLSAGRP
jgi:hypothetical protein